MTRLLPFLLLLAPACAIAREDLAPELVPAYDAAQAALEDADPLNDAAAEEQLARIEAKVLQDRARPAADLIPGGLGALIVAAVPLLGKRGRRHYAGAIKSISRGRIVSAAGDVLKALGAQHSNPESAAAAEPQPPRA